MKNILIIAFLVAGFAANAQEQEKKAEAKLASPSGKTTTEQPKKAEAKMHDPSTAKKDKASKKPENNRTNTTPEAKLSDK